MHIIYSILQKQGEVVKVIKWKSIEVSLHRLESYCQGWLHQTVISSAHSTVAS